MNPAVIIPWRKGETELQTTIESATRSIGAGMIIPVEDTSGDGPAMTRHRGAVAAREKGADVCVMVDAHMLFQGDVLRGIARQAARHSGLYCAICHHNLRCAFDDRGYYGGDIYYKAADQNGPQSLCWKWSADVTPGPRACAGGACYVFRTDWYFDTGECFSALPAWGCDEEALSITAWLSGHMPRVYDGHVAHRYRDQPPWGKLGGARSLQTSRAAMICAVVSDIADRNELLAYQGSAPVESPEVDRWRAALKRQPRTWEQWKMEVPIMARAKTSKQLKAAASAKERTERRSTGRANYGATENGRMCKCGHEESSIDSIRQTGRMIVRYRVCCKCGARRTTQQIVATA